MTLAIYGGSFNPPHLGHIRAAKAAAEQLAPERFVFVPDREPPHKELAAGSPDPQTRLELTRLAAQEIAGAEVVDWELFRQGPSYTVDTLREAKRLYPADRLVFLMGTDMFLTLDEWREPQEICRLAEIGVFARGDGERELIREKKKEWEERFGALVRIIEHEPLDISSTELREMLPQRRGREYLSDAVYGEIIRQRLYGAKPDLAWLRDKAYAFLKPQRIPHVHGTEQEAVKLAQRWGENAEDAAEAAILHDMTKKLSYDEHIRLCEQYSVPTDSLEKENEKLLHSKTGAALAKFVFGVPENIESAIRWHTTGRAGMTKLEQIVYLADYIEPTRHGFDGLEELRGAAYRDLDEAMAMALGMSCDEVTEKGRPFHPNSAQAKEYFEARMKGCEETGVLS